MSTPECMVAGCGSSAHAVRDITADQPHQGWSRLPGDVLVCNLHADQLKDPDTEWLLVRDERTLYVGDSLRNLDEYVLLDVDTIMRHGTAREFSRQEDDGHHMVLKVRQRGGPEKKITLVIPSDEIAKVFKEWAKLLPPIDD